MAKKLSNYHGKLLPAYASYEDIIDVLGEAIGKIALDNGISKEEAKDRLRIIIERKPPKTKSEDVEYMNRKINGTGKTGGCRTEKIYLKRSFGLSVLSPLLSPEAYNAFYKVAPDALYDNDSWDWEWTVKNEVLFFIATSLAANKDSDTPLEELIGNKLEDASDSAKRNASALLGMRISEDGRFIRTLSGIIKTIEKNGAAFDHRKLAKDMLAWNDNKNIQIVWAKAINKNQKTEEKENDKND